MRASHRPTILADTPEQQLTIHWQQWVRALCAKSAAVRSHQSALTHPSHPHCVSTSHCTYTCTHSHPRSPSCPPIPHTFPRFSMDVQESALPTVAFPIEGEFVAGWTPPLGAKPVAFELELASEGAAFPPSETDPESHQASCFKITNQRPVSSPLYFRYYEYV